MKWFHVQCCDISEDVKYANKGAWTCPSCRQMPERLATMQTTIDSVLAMLQALTTESIVEAGEDESEVDENESHVVMNNSHLEENENEDEENDGVEHLENAEEVIAIYVTPIVHIQNPYSVLADQDSEDVMNDDDAVQEAWLDEKANKHKQKKAANTVASSTTTTATSDGVEVTGTEEPLSDQDAQVEAKAKQHQANKMAAKSSEHKFKVTVFSDSVLKKVNIQRTESLCSEANCQFTLVPDTYTIGQAVSRIQGPSKHELPAHLQPTQIINLSPEDPVIIHTGTNHIEKESVYSTTLRLERLEYNLKCEGYKRVALSSIVYRRTDNLHERGKIAALNNIILTICTRNGWTYIDNDNVDDSCIIHADKVHPNEYGVEKLTKNIATAVKQLILHPHH